MPSRRSHPQVLIAVITAIVVVVLGAGAAAAAWSIGGSGDGQAAASALAAPTVTATTSSTSPSSATEVSWTATNQLAGVTYAVVRSPGNVTLGCTASPCSDTGLSPSTDYTYTVTAKLGGNWTAVGSASATTDALAGPTTLAISAPPSVTAGASSQVALTAKRADGSTDTTFSGVKSLDWAGSATGASPGGATATLPTSASFTSGVATVAVTLVDAGVSLDLSASAGAVNGSASVTVNPATATRLGFLQAQVSGRPAPLDCIFTCDFPNLGNGGSITAKVGIFDAYGNTPANRTSNLSVTVARTGLDSVSLTVPTGNTVTSGTVNAAGANANYDITLAASASGFTSGSASIHKN